MSPNRLNVAEESTGAPDQFRGIDEMRGAAIVDENLEVRVALYEMTGGARVIEVDVREQYRADVSPLRAGVGERLVEATDGNLGPRVDQNQSAIRINHTGCDDRRGVGVMEIEEVSLGTNEFHVPSRLTLEPVKTVGVGRRPLEPTDGITRGQIVPERGAGAQTPAFRDVRGVLFELLNIVGNRHMYGSSRG